jgi:hypothetical protein
LDWLNLRGQGQNFQELKFLLFKEALKEIFEDFEEPRVENFLDDGFFGDFDFLAGLEYVNTVGEELLRIRHFHIFWSGVRL